LKKTTQYLMAFIAEADLAFPLGAQVIIEGTQFLWFHQARVEPNTMRANVREKRIEIPVRAEIVFPNMAAPPFFSVLNPRKYPKGLQWLEHSVTRQSHGRTGADPRVPSSGQSIWSFMWEIKGEGFLKKLAQQELFLTRDLRQLTDALAKGKIALAFGIGRSQAEPFVKAGLPIKPAPAPKEGLPASNSFGVIGIVKDPPHPNATKVFVNWFLSREGQDWYGRVMQNGTRRLDADTRWLKKLGVEAAKDVLTLQEYHRVRNHLEDKYTKVRLPGGKFAETIFQ